MVAAPIGRDANPLCSSAFAGSVFLPWQLGPANGKCPSLFRKGYDLADASSQLGALLSSPSARPQRGICAKGRIMSSPDEHRFLEVAPVEEEVTAFDLPVTGQVPDGLNGRYLRNGPNPLGLDDPSYHWFVGAGMVHGVRLRDGKAEWYRNRWVRSKAVAEQLHEKWPTGPVHEDMDFAANTCIISTVAAPSPRSRRARCRTR